jgi:hypothetical protein
MTIQDTLNSVFPSGVLTHLITEDLGAFEIALPKNSQPQNCQILARGHDTVGYRRREFFLVRATDGTVLFFSIPEAEQDSGYEEFVTGHGFAGPELGDRAIELEAYARKRIEIFSDQPSSIH